MQLERYMIFQRGFLLLEGVLFYGTYGNQIIHVPHTGFGCIVYLVW